MLEVNLTIQSPQGTRTVPVTGDRLSIGRSTAANVIINDEGLSRVHATIYRQGDKIWVLDDGSSGGTFVNGKRIPPAGTPLKNGDRIKLSGQTTITISTAKQRAAKAAAPVAAASGAPAKPFPVLPLAAGLVVVVTLIVGGAVLGTQYFKDNDKDRRNRQQQARRDGAEEVDKTAQVKDPADPPAEESRESATPPTAGGSNGTGTGTSSLPPVGGNTTPPPSDPNARARTYRQMTKEQQREFIVQEAQRVSRMIGNRPCAFTEEVLDIIQYWVDAYSRRVGNKSTKMWGEDLNFVFARARKHAPYIIRSFKAEGVAPVVGIYIPAIETEYVNICRENFAGAMGLFQFIGPTAKAYGVDPADRCDVAKMAPAAARYFQDRMAEFGPDAVGVGLSIAGYNRSPDSVRRDLHDVINSDNKERSFWILVANASKLDHYFQNENIKYVPRFFAYAIIGENPWAFGLDMNSLSTYTEETPQPAQPVK